MRGNSRRLDVCLGDFAVSIQGYDDPVGVLEDVLNVARRVAAESPDLLNSEAVFDEATIAKVIERVARRAGVDVESLGAVPGLVLVHRGEETDGGLSAIREGAAGDADEPAASEPAEDRFAALRRRFEAADGDEHAARGGGEPQAGDAAGMTATMTLGDDEIEGERDQDDRHESAEAHEGALQGSDAGEDGDDGTDRVVNIFGAPPTPETAGDEKPARRPLFTTRAATPAAAEVAPSAPPRRPAEGVGLGDRFESLLAKVHGKTADPSGRPAPAASAAPSVSPVAVAGMTPAQVAAAAGAEDAQDAMLSAAAYLTIVRRQPKFTRRELMAVFDEIPGEFPRTLEVQIKGIGKLTRAGSLRRVDDDHFGLSRDLTEQFEPLLRG